VGFLVGPRGPSGACPGGPPGPVLAPFWASFASVLSAFLGAVFGRVLSCGVWFGPSFWALLGLVFGSFWLSFGGASRPQKH